MFWYGPFTCDENHIAYSRSFSLYYLKNVLQRAHELQPGFFTTPQAFCWLDMETGQYDGWMYPTTAELSAETMLDLAHGVKGINYEQYFSYESVPPHVSYGLVDLASNNFSPRALWYKVQSLASRINGPFGQNLSYLNYTGHSLMLRKNVDPSSANTPDSVHYDYLTLKKTTSDNQNFHAGFFIPDSLHNPSDNNYFLLVNLITTSTRVVNIGITNPFNYVNLRLRNVEPEFNFDTCFTAPMNFNYEIPAGEGYLFQFFPVVKYGGRLYYNDTIQTTLNLSGKLTIYPNACLTVSGTYNLYDTLIINTGGTLKITEGGKINVYEGAAIINYGTIDADSAELKFAAGICLRNEGELNAEETLFSALSTNWGGIYFASGSTGLINICTIEKATSTGSALITTNDSSPEIKNSTLRYCHTGINVLAGSEPGIHNNTISDVSANGIYIDDSSPYLWDNTISGTNRIVGSPVKCNYHADARFFEPQEPDLGGRNTLQEGYYGVYAYNNSTVTMGAEEQFGHLNRIINNDYYAYSGYNSVIYGQLNWWGTEEPDDDSFISDTSSFIYYKPYLTSDPQQGFASGTQGNYTQLSQQLMYANRLIINGNYLQAVSILRTIISGYPTSDEAAIALAGLKNVYLGTDDSQVLSFITQLSDSTNSHPLRLKALESLSGIYLKKKNFQLAERINNYLIVYCSNTVYERAGRRNKFYTHIAKEEYINAKAELETIKTKYDRDDEIGAMDWLLYLEGYNPLLIEKTDNTRAAAKTGYRFSSQNYPNPFNPSTTIRFYIEQRGKVSLRVYDILGRNLRTLVDETKEPGEYEISFDGSRLASGVYIYRLQSGEQVLTRKFILLK